MPDKNTFITEQTLDWLNCFIITYNICPFARKPVKQNTLRIAVSNAVKKASALEELMNEIHLLDHNSQIETTLVVFSQAFKDFFTYLGFVDLAERLLSDQGYDGIYQLASFHPDYYFADTEPDDVTNYTNRSPYPMVHLLREESLDKAIEAYGDTKLIPKKNKETLRQSGLAKVKKILNYE